MNIVESNQKKTEEQLKLRQQALDNDKDDQQIPDPQKKKKKKKKKKKADTAAEANEPKLPVHIELAPQNPNRFQDNSHIRMLGNWNEGTWRQTSPPTIPVSRQFQPGKFPINEQRDYMDMGVRRSSQQAKKKQLLYESTLDDLRKGAQVHRQVRKFAQTILKPGKKLIDICDQIEALNRTLCQADGIKCGVGFPTGCSLNYVAAHYTPNPGDDTVLKYQDVCKIDFGTHYNGRIIDSAFTVAFDPKYDNLLKAVKEATNAGIAAAGIDARLGEIGKIINEVMESYQVQIDGKIYPVKTVRNLNGHSIKPYQIHAGKTVPCIPNGSAVKMQQGQCYAIETFGSTGKGLVKDDLQCSHYMLDFYAPKTKKVTPKAKSLLTHIEENYSTLAFCKKWLWQDGQEQYFLPLRDLVNSGLVNPYPPLCDKPGSYVAQYQHTLFLRPTCKQVLSRGDDY